MSKGKNGKSMVIPARHVKRVVALIAKPKPVKWKPAALSAAQLAASIKRVDALRIALRDNVRLLTPFAKEVAQVDDVINCGDDYLPEDVVVAKQRRKRNMQLVKAMVALSDAAYSFTHDW